MSEKSLATFPAEFREGMAARASILGDTGTCAPEHWVGGLAGDDVHAIAILFSRTEEQCARSIAEHDKLLARTHGVRSLSYLDLNASPPFNYAHDHFGFRDRLSQPVMKGSGEEPTPGSGDALEPGEFILGYPDENGPVANLPQPAVLSRNGSFMAYRRLQEHVGTFREYLSDQAETPEEQELLAAKFMGRWRSGAPPVLAPEHDDPELGADPMRNNDFNYKEMDPHGYACPLGSHARRLNPRDTAHYMNRRRMIRRGATYGPALPDGAPDDGVERGIAAFIICADLVRQFEFAQNVWINDKAFHELGNEHDPIAGTQDGTLDFTVPKRPIRKVHKGLPAFTTLTGGAYFFLPGWSYPWEAQRDPASMANRFSTITEVRNVLWPAYETPEYDAANFLQGIPGTLELFHRSTLAFQALAEEATGHPVAVFQRIDQAGYRLPIDERILADTDTLMVFGLDHLPSEQDADPEEIDAIGQWLQREGTCLVLAPHHDVGFTEDYSQRQVEYLHHGDRLVPRQQRFSQYTRSLMTALDVPVHNTWGLRPAVVDGTNQIAPLTAIHDLDATGLLANVTTFNFHPHLPHYALTAPESQNLRVLGRQRVDPNRPHPFTEAGNTEFNALISMPPTGQRAGHIVLVDSTNFTTLFGGTDSLQNFWRNVSTMK